MEAAIRLLASASQLWGSYEVSRFMVVMGDPLPLRCLLRDTCGAVQGKSGAYVFHEGKGGGWS